MAALRLKAYFDVVGMEKVVKKECEDFRKFGIKIKRDPSLKNLKKKMKMTNHSKRRLQ